MTDTLPNVVLPRHHWMDLYGETGIVTGSVISVKNVGTALVYLTVSETKPLNLDAYFTLHPGESAINKYGDSGAWAYARYSLAKISVQEVL